MACHAIEDFTRNCYLFYNVTVIGVRTADLSC